MLSIGSPAPEIATKLDNGVDFRLSSEKNNTVVLYFYPKDFTPGCTKQACLLRDQYSELKAMGAKLYGISADSPSSHESFKKEHSLPYPLISDTDGKIRKDYEVGKLLGIFPLPSRVTYVIDGTGKIRAAIHHDFQVEKNVEKTFEAVKALAKK